MGNHANISIFVPHLGCSYRCSFCDQRSITGQNELPNENTVKQAVATALKSPNYSPNTTEIAFFGGSFTAIEQEYMISLLKAAFEFVKDKTVMGIRISTRPDAINKETLEILKKYGVTAIELGAQSMNDNVLLANNRGHSKEDVIRASTLIKQYGFSLGLQMMTGLYKATPKSDMETVREFIKIAPNTVRIYPTVVLEHTALALLFKEKKYIPFSLEETVKNCCLYYNEFTKNNIKVIRMGLHHINQNDYVAGPWHPAFSELCQSHIFIENLLKEISRFEKGSYIIKTCDKGISVAVGHKKKNINILKNKGYKCRVVGDSAIEFGSFLIEKEVR